MEIEDDENSIWSLNLQKLQFSPQTLENYKLVPGAYSEILNRITYELWAELLYSYEILKLSIWSSNLTKITICPKKFDKIPEWSELRMNYGQNFGIFMNL